MAALLAEYGNQIYWCTSVTCEENISVLSYQDQEVNHYLNKQRKAGFLTESPFSQIPLDIEVYLFCFSPTQIELALKTVEKLSERPIVHPRLMINGSTFGLHGTNQLKQHYILIFLLIHSVLFFYFQTFHYFLSKNNI